MKAVLLTVLASLFLVGLVNGQADNSNSAILSRLQALEARASALEARATSAEARANIATIKDNVREFMNRYPFVFDHFVAFCGPLNNQSNPGCPAALDAVMDLFCDAQSFQGWHDWFAGIPIPDQLTPAAVRGFYLPLPGAMGGLSDHRVFGGIVTVAADLSSATFKGKLAHGSSNAAGGFATDYGTYTNGFKVATDLSVCMSSFSLMTSHVIAGGPFVLKDTSRI